MENQAELKQLERKRGLYFRYKTRCIINVASAVADEIINNYCYDLDIGKRDTCYTERSVLLSIRGKVPVCSFEGGTTVRVNTVNRCLYDEELREKGRGRENWVVTHCNVRFYPRFANNIPHPQKTAQAWDTSMLRKLREIRQWRYPDIMSINELIAKYPEFEDDYNPWEYHPEEYYANDDNPDEVDSVEELDDIDNLHADNPVEVDVESNWSMGQRYI